MSRMKRRLAAGLAAGAIACAAPAIVYIWDAGGANDNWTTMENWNRQFSIYDYPNDNGDDAVFPGNDNWHGVINGDFSIDTLQIDGSTEFECFSFPNKTLTVNTLTITGGSGGTSLAISSGAIETNTNP